MNKYIIKGNIQQLAKVCMLYTITQHVDITRYILHILAKLLNNEYDMIVGLLRQILNNTGWHATDAALHRFLNNIDKVVSMVPLFNLIEPSFLAILLRYDHKIAFVKRDGERFLSKIKKKIQYHGVMYDVHITQYYKSCDSCLSTWWYAIANANVEKSPVIFKVSESVV